LIALPLMVLSPVLLIKDLGRPRKFLHMLRVVKLKSPMSVGSWGLTIFGGFAGLSALLEIVDRAEHRRPLRRGVAALGAPFALLVGGYGGVLLSATAIPLWARGRFLWGPVFLASAFSTGGATIEAALALGGDRRALDRLGRAHLLPLAAEAALLVAGLARLGPAVAPLTKGRWRSLFLPGVFGLGLALPLAQGLRKSLGPGRDAGHGRVESVLSTFAILLGGLILRACVVYAGRDSADDAATYFALTGSVDERA
jgi:formate-dependent nitrite reductase membrane component NrfD